MLGAMDRRAFLKSGLMMAAVTAMASTKCAGISVPSVSSLFGADSEAELPDLCTGKVMTVSGAVSPSKLGVTLSHERLICDFSGMESSGAIRYDMKVAFKTVLPALLALKRTGCETLVECTPAYMGRNVRFLQRLAKVSDLNILTNTGYYGVGENKFVPAQAFTDSAEDLAFRWVREAWYGIGETGIRPGFIQIGVDKGGLSSFQGKLFQAASKAHLQTGLPIMVYSEDAIPVSEGLSFLCKDGLDASAVIWVQTGSASDEDRLELARLGVWVCLDGIPRAENVKAMVKLLQKFQKEELLDRVLLSQNHYWSLETADGKGTLKWVGDEEKKYRIVSTDLIPQLRESDFSRSDVRQMMEKNPKEAFEIGVHKGKAPRKKYLLF